jgi:hypothetical protein
VKSKADYGTALAIVREELRRWDPYSLLESGAPRDELDSEAALIVARLQGVRSESQLTDAISSVFGKCFEPAHFPLAACAQVSGRIYARLHAAQLLAPG